MQDRKTNSLVPRVGDGCGGPCVVLVVYAVGGHAQDVCAGCKAAVNEEGGADRALEGAQRDLRRVWENGVSVYMV
jgi:hypothetical protein